MNTRTEAALARESLETQIKIVPTGESTRYRLLARLGILSDEGILHANAFVVATLAEKVSLDVEMLTRFLEEARPVEDIEVA